MSAASVPAAAVASFVISGAAGERKLTMAAGGESNGMFFISFILQHVSSRSFSDKSWWGSR